MHESKEAALARMRELFDVANRACNDGRSTSDFEEAFVVLLTYLEEHPECRPQAEIRFIEGVREGKLCWELITFCMHKLRLDGVRQETIRALAALGDARNAAALSHILESFEDAWEDADMYAYYEKG